MPGYTSLEAMRPKVHPVIAERRARGMAAKFKVLQGGALVRCRDYCRASRDRYKGASSVTTQARRNEELREEYGWTSLGTYEDNDRPASARARKAGITRPGYEKMIEDIRRDPGDVLILFEMARGTRDYMVFRALLELCQESGPFIWVVGGQPYDVRDRNDRKALSDMAQKAESGSEDISEHVTAGLESQALDGRPHGQTPFGYQRFKDEVTGKFARQIVDEREQPGNWTPAGIVREIFASYLRGVGVWNICRSLNDRDIPPPRKWAAMQVGDPKRIKRWANQQWTEGAMYSLLRNAAYIGVRDFKGQGATGKCRWPGIIDGDDYLKAQRRMQVNGLKDARDKSAQSLLTYLMWCGKCGEQVMHMRPTERNKYATYRCRRGCAAVPVAETDKYIIREVLAIFMADATARKVRELSANRVEAGDAEMKLKAIMDDLAVRLAVADDDERDDYSMVDYNRHYAKVKPRIAALKEQIKPVGGVPENVRRMAGGDAERLWARMTLEQRRDFLRSAVRIEIHPCGRGRSHGRELEGDRVRFTEIWQRV